MDGADVCRTSSRASRRPPDVISTIAILNPRWRRWKWRHPGPGARFSIPIEEWGGKWRPFRFRSPSWVTSFVGTGNEVIQDGRRKRKGRHFPPHSSMGIEKLALYYWQGFTLVPASISDHILYKVWVEITYPFPNFNSATDEFLEDGCHLNWSTTLPKGDHFLEFHYPVNPFFQATDLGLGTQKLC